MNLTTIERGFEWKDFIESNGNDWNKIAACGNLKPSFINQYADKLDLDLVCYKQTLKMNTIDRFFDRILPTTFYHHVFPAIPNFRTDILERHLDKITPIMWRSISRYLELNLDFVKRHEKELFWDKLKRNYRLKPEIRKYYKLDRY